MAPFLEWLIIGGGIHGTYLANLLTGQLGVARGELRVLDPHPNLLAAWSRNTANCGMDYLRSPATHNIDLHILSLYRFARSLPDRDFIPPYNRPSLSLFQKHCAHVIESNRLDDLHIDGRVEALQNHQSFIQVETTAGEFKARNVMLAIGMGEQPSWPDWAVILKRQGADIQHMFSRAFDRRSLSSTSRTVVVGGGISAVQIALKLAREQTGEIIVLSGHQLREQFYDFNPCWIGPKCLTDYYTLDYHRRRRIIDRERVPGTIPAEVLESFTAALENGNPRFRNERVEGGRFGDDGIELITRGGTIRADRLLLATGFENRRPGGPLIEQIISEFDLSCNECGYPIVGKDLRWGEHVFVTGPLAELQVGPCARNIIGARNAGRFLSAALKK